MLKFSERLHKLRENVDKTEKQNQIYKAVKSMLIKVDSKKVRGYVQNITNKSTKYRSFTRTRSVCMLTGRTRSVYRYVSLSRMKMREYVNAGYFVGMTKSSW